jgi:hypothetical protein
MYAISREEVQKILEENDDGRSAHTSGSKKETAPQVSADEIIV